MPVSRRNCVRAIFWSISRRRRASRASTGPSPSRSTVRGRRSKPSAATTLEAPERSNDATTVDPPRPPALGSRWSRRGDRAVRGGGPARREARPPVPPVAGRGRPDPAQRRAGGLLRPQGGLPARRLHPEVLGVARPLPGDAGERVQADLVRPPGGGETGLRQHHRGSRPLPPP